mmetsp:Transcript_94616/g.244862  ORF Transcript_94616/g.244862 Transcript_94616/m.244862 type:complete len:461 (-) Transcript_94616:44-1426(-)
MSAAAVCAYGVEDISGLREALSARDAEILDLQEQIRVRQASDQRDFLADNSDQLAGIISAKNEVIQALQQQLAESQGGEGVARALDRAAANVSELQRLDGVVRDLQRQLQSQGEELQRVFTERDAAQALAAEAEAAAAFADAAAVAPPAVVAGGVASFASEELAGAALEELERLRSELQESNNELQAARCEAAMLSQAETEIAELQDRLKCAEARTEELANATAANSGGADNAKNAADDNVGVKEVGKLRTVIKQKEQQSLQLANMVEQLSEALESKTQQLTAATKALKDRESQDAALASCEDGPEHGRLRAELKAARGEAAASRKQAQELSSKVQRLEVQLSAARAAEHEAIRNAAKVESQCMVLDAEKQHSALLGVKDGNAVGGAIAGSLRDVELGEKAAVTLTDLGVGHCRALGPLDRLLQRVSALMTVRADARLFGFGIWAFCHLIYVTFLVHYFI